jgi:flagellum-specific ATP synthase
MSALLPGRTTWANRLAPYAARAGERVGPLVEGELVRMVGLTLEAVGARAPLGGRCRIARPDGGTPIEAEVVGAAGDRLFLMPVVAAAGLMPGARVTPLAAGGDVEVGDGLLGRVIDGLGNPLDGHRPPEAQGLVPLAGERLNPVARQPITEPIDVGVRAINALLTVGRGQRMGLFAGSGVGKSVLLGMMTRYTDADVTVVALVGERGREVNDFVQRTLGPEGMTRAVVVTAPADHPPLARLYCALRATAIAEHFRDRGQRVLLLMDSLTRFAQAQREIALATGEPPATKGYTPSVFARLPQLVERAGTGTAPGGGSITAFYTVLTEGDDLSDPVVDAARAILDGQVVLSREIADRGRFPAIDLEGSVSRLMNDLATPGQLGAARRFRRLYGLHAQQRDLINVGAYKRGSDPQVDAAIDMHPHLEAFLQQDRQERVSLAASIQALETLLTQEAGAGAAA